MYMFCRIMSAKKFRNLNFKACGFQENMISYRQRVNMDPGGKGAPLARRTPKECVFAQPCHVFLHTFIRNTTAVSCKAGGGGASGMLSFPKPVPPLAHGAARSGEHRGRKTHGNVNSKCEKNIKKYNQASRANSSRHSANTISAVFQPNISRG